MLTRIAAFELRYQLRSPLFFISFAIFFLLTFGSVVIDQIQIGSRGNVNVNSPYAILETLATMDVFAVFIVTAFVANVTLRDRETGFAPILFSTRRQTPTARRPRSTPPRSPSRAPHSAGPLASARPVRPARAAGPRAALIRPSALPCCRPFAVPR